MLIPSSEYWKQIQEYVIDEAQSRDEICKRSGKGRGVVSMGLLYARKHELVQEVFVKGKPRYKNLDSPGNQE